MKIFIIRSGINNCYIIKANNNAIMVDAGQPKQVRTFLKHFKQFSIQPEDIKLIILTHGDFDHVGSSKDLQKLTGAKLVIHEKDRKNLEEGIFNWPPGVTRWGKISHFLFSPLVQKILKFEQAKADIVLDSNAFLLNDFGIDGKVVHTPGHTQGSISVVLDSGDAFVGCMAHNRLPFTTRPSLPIYAEDISQLKKSWKILLDNNAKTIYPGHGKPFPIDKIRKYIT